MDSSYITSALKAEQLPECTAPEIAVVGRSNAGKSTLINKLLNRKKLVRSGRTPGQTQLINFFSINNQCIFADLPGYGYSANNKDQRHHWQKLMETYLQRPTLEKILYIFDIRRTLTDEDLDLVDWMSRNATIVFVANKTDKLSQAEVQKSCNLVRKQLEALEISDADIWTVSAMKNKGVDRLRESILSAVQET